MYASFYLIKMEVADRSSDLKEMNNVIRNDEKQTNRYKKEQMVEK